MSCLFALLFFQSVSLIQRLPRSSPSRLSHENDDDDDDVDDDDDDGYAEDHDYEVFCITKLGADFLCSD